MSTTSDDGKIVTVTGRFLGSYHAHRCSCDEFVPSGCVAGGFMPFEKTSAMTSPFVELTVRAILLRNGLWRVLEVTKESPLPRTIVELGARCEREYPDLGSDARRVVEGCFRRIASTDDPKVIDTTRLSEIKKHDWAKRVISAKSSFPRSPDTTASRERCLDELSTILRHRRELLNVSHCTALHPLGSFAAHRACLMVPEHGRSSKRSGAGSDEGDAQTRKRKRVGRKYRKRRAAIAVSDDDISDDIDREDEEDEDEEDRSVEEVPNDDVTDAVDDRTDRKAASTEPIVVASAHRTFAPSLVAALKTSQDGRVTLLIDPDESFVDADVERFVRSVVGDQKSLPEFEVPATLPFNAGGFRALLKSREFIDTETLKRYSTGTFEVRVGAENASAAQIVDACVRDRLRSSVVESCTILISDTVDATPFAIAFELDVLRVGRLVAVDGDRDFGVLESARSMPGGRALPKKSRAFIHRTHYELSLSRPDGSRFVVDTERTPVRNAAGGCLRDWLGPVVDRVDFICGRQTPRVDIAIAAKYCCKRLVIWFCDCHASTLGATD